MSEESRFFDPASMVGENSLTSGGVADGGTIHEDQQPIQEASANTQPDQPTDAADLDTPATAEEVWASPCASIHKKHLTNEQREVITAGLFQLTRKDLNNMDPIDFYMYVNSRLADLNQLAGKPEESVARKMFEEFSSKLYCTCNQVNLHSPVCLLISKILYENPWFVVGNSLDRIHGMVTRRSSKSVSLIDRTSLSMAFTAMYSLKVMNVERAIKLGGYRHKKETPDKIEYPFDTKDPTAWASDTMPIGEYMRTLIHMAASKWPELDRIRMVPSKLIYYELDMSLEFDFYGIVPFDQLAKSPFLSPATLSNQGRALSLLSSTIQDSLHAKNYNGLKMRVCNVAEPYKLSVRDFFASIALGVEPNPNVYPESVKHGEERDDILLDEHGWPQHVFSFIIPMIFPPGEDFTQKIGLNVMERNACSHAFVGELKGGANHGHVYFVDVLALLMSCKLNDGYATNTQYYREPSAEAAKISKDISSLLKPDSWS